MFSYEVCGNLIVVNNGGELAGIINQKKKLHVLQQPIDVDSVINVPAKSASSLTMRNIVN